MEITVLQIASNFMHELV